MRAFRKAFKYQKKRWGGDHWVYTYDRGKEVKTRATHKEAAEHRLSGKEAFWDGHFRELLEEWHEAQGEDKSDLYEELQAELVHAQNELGRAAAIHVYNRVARKMKQRTWAQVTTETKIQAREAINPDKPPAWYSTEIQGEVFSEMAAPAQGEEGFKPEPALYAGKISAVDLADHIFEQTLAVREDPDFGTWWRWWVEEGAYADASDPVDHTRDDLADFMGVPGVDEKGEQLSTEDRWEFAQSVMALVTETTDSWHGSDFGQAMSDKELRRRAKKGKHTTSRDLYTSARIAREAGGEMPEWVGRAILADHLSPGAQNRLVFVPKKEAFDFIKEHHSAKKDAPYRGLLFTLGIRRGDRLVAVATAGTPGGRWGAKRTDKHNVLELTRVASDGTVKGASSKLVSRLIDILDKTKRGAKDKPALLVTYQLTSEEGTTYKALKDKGLRPVERIQGKAPSGARAKSKDKIAQADKIVWEAGSIARDADWSLLEDKPLTFTALVKEGRKQDRALWDGRMPQDDPPDLDQVAEGIKAAHLETKPYLSGASSPTGKGAKILSLFSGVGGLDLGISRALPDAEHTGFVERAKLGQKVLAKQYPGVPVHDDVVSFAQAAEAGEITDAPNIVLGGFPCQDVSALGKRKGLEGERSGLYYSMEKIVKVTDPDWVVYENVPALRSSGLEHVLSGQRDMGYEVTWDGVPASAVGASHIRDRIFVVAHRPGVDFQWRKPDDYSHYWKLGPPTIDQEAPRPMTKPHLKAAGNAVAPAVAEHLGKLISESKPGVRSLEGEKVFAVRRKDGVWVYTKHGAKINKKAKEGAPATSWPRAGVMRGDKVYQVESKTPYKRGKNLLKQTQPGQLVWVRNPDPEERLTQGEVLGLSEKQMQALALINSGFGEETYTNQALPRLDPETAEEKTVFDSLVTRGYLNADYSLTFSGQAAAKTKTFRDYYFEGDQRPLLGDKRLNAAVSDAPMMLWRRDRGGVSHENSARVVEHNTKDNKVVVYLNPGFLTVLPMEYLSYYPTPGAEDDKGGRPRSKEDVEAGADPFHAWRKRGAQLKHWVDSPSKVSPEFSEYLMGFPEGWITDHKGGYRWFVLEAIGLLGGNRGSYP